MSVSIVNLALYSVTYARNSDSLPLHFFHKLVSFQPCKNKSGWTKVCCCLLQEHSSYAPAIEGFTSMYASANV